MTDFIEHVESPLSETSENTPAESMTAKRKWSDWFTPEHCLNGLLLVSVAQLMLAILIYLLAAVQFKVLFIEAVAMMALALFSRYRGTVLRWRVLLRVVYLAALAFVLVGSATLIILIIAQTSVSDNGGVWQDIEANFWMVVGILALPALLFLQPAMAVIAKNRYRFDLVAQRITAIAVLLLSVLLCVFALEYTLNGERMIINSISYSPVLFGHQMNITIAIDNILTRILFCLCSVAMVVFAFKLHSLPREKTPKEKKKKRVRNK